MRKVKEEQLFNIYHHVKVSQIPAEMKRLTEESFGESHRVTLCSHKAPSRSKDISHV